MKIFVQKNGEQLGPYTLELVNGLLAQDSLKSTYPAWHEGMSDWVALSQIEGVVDVCSSVPPTFEPAKFNSDVPAPSLEKPSAIKRFLPVIILIVSPIIGLVLGGIVAAGMYPMPEIIDTPDVDVIRERSNQGIAVIEKRMNVQVVGFFGCAAIGIIVAIRRYKSNKIK